MLGCAAREPSAAPAATSATAATRQEISERFMSPPDRMDLRTTRAGRSLRDTMLAGIDPGGHVPYGCHRARQDPEHRRRRPPRRGEDLARGGAALPGGKDEPARDGRAGHDRLRLGRARAEARHVALRLAL